MLTLYFGMKRPFLSTILLLFAALSCVPGIDPEVVESGLSEAPPDENGQIVLTVGAESNLQDFISVKFSTIGVDGRGRYGDFSSLPSFSRNWNPRQGNIKVAFMAEQKKEFPDDLEGVPEDVTFNVWAMVQTPTSGYKITWCGLNSLKLDKPDILYDYTVTALNKGIYGQPKGTADKYFVQFDISLAPDGGYSVSPKWVKGSIFKEEKKEEK